MKKKKRFLNTTIITHSIDKIQLKLPNDESK